jgi:hypothetical protein
MNPIITERRLSAMRYTHVSGRLPASQATITYLRESRPFIVQSFHFFLTYLTAYTMLNMRCVGNYVHTVHEISKRCVSECAARMYYYSYNCNLRY